MPKELGHTANCLMFGMCNYLGSSCALYEKHTAKTRKALQEAIEMKQKDGERDEVITTYGTIVVEKLK